MDTLRHAHEHAHSTYRIDARIAGVRVRWHVRASLVKIPVVVAYALHAYGYGAECNVCMRVGMCVCVVRVVTSLTVTLWTAL